MIGGSQVTKKQMTTIRFVLFFLLLFVTMACSVEQSLATTGKGIIQYQSADWSTPPVDPENPGQEVDPEGEIIKTNGPLRLDFVPSLSFGRQRISEDDQLYFANAQQFKDETPARANYLQVTDNRGTLSGWELYVRQEKQFSNENAKHSELAGALLSFDNQWANSISDKHHAPTIVKDAITIDEMGTSYPIAIAKQGKGSGTWTISFGASAQENEQPTTLFPSVKVNGEPDTDVAVSNKPRYTNKAISLFVPGRTIKDPVKYTTVLTWVIAELT